MSPRPHTGRAGRLVALLARNRDLLVSWLIFLSILGLAVAVDQWATHWINEDLAIWTAHLSAWILRLLGVEGAQAQGVDLNALPVCSFQIIGECTAFYPFAIYIGAVLSFPCRFSRRLLGVALGLPTLVLINQVRLVSLCYIAKWYPDLFETLHILVWQSLIIFLTILLWIIWVSTLAGRHETEST